jgi:hypothetical protein
MLHFYDGQIRKYITQTIRVFSNFVVKSGDGTLTRIPVMYGDQDRQVASIITQNSENKINSVPKIAVYVSSLDVDRDRLADQTYIGKVHIRERDFDGSNHYTNNQGKNYTVERLMPTPFLLKLKVDIWSANTDQKLQILEQILVLFNPSLELQTNDNFVDWTSLTVLNLDTVTWSSRQVPMGTQTGIEISSLSLSTPIWISPPAKVKHLGVITHIITSMFEGSSASPSGYIEGLGQDLADSTISLSTLLSEQHTTITDYKILIYNGDAVILGPSEDAIPREPGIDLAIKQGIPIDWHAVLNSYPGKFIAGASKLYVLQSDGSEVTGTVAINPMDSTILTVNWDSATYPANDYINTDGSRQAGGGRSTGTFDAIIDPSKVYPGNGMSNVVAGDRFLIIEDIGNLSNIDGPDGWKNSNGTNFIAKANDIIEWQGTAWHIIFDAAQNTDNLIYQTNIYNGKQIQYKWNGVSWVKSFEGEYGVGYWRLVL